MKVTYLYHSGFVVEWDEVVFIFDYFRGELPDLKDAKQIFVFSSHRHYDHFKRKIFEWKQNYQNITYFLSEDIPKKAYMQDAIFMGPNVSKEYGDLKVRTLKSTDEGVAFLVHYKGKSLFHAGDLNWWHWEEEGSVFNEMMKRNYQYAISKIEGESIDIAFIPVDARLGEYCYNGMDWFMKHTCTRYVFPMHFWGDYSVCERLCQREEAEEYRAAVMKIKEENQIFYLEDEIEYI